MSVSNEEKTSQIFLASVGAYGTNWYGTSSSSIVALVAAVRTSPLCDQSAPYKISRIIGSPKALAEGGRTSMGHYRFGEGVDVYPSEEGRVEVRDVTDEASEADRNEYDDVYQITIKSRDLEE